MVLLMGTGSNSQANFLRWGMREAPETRPNATSTRPRKVGACGQLAHVPESPIHGPNRDPRSVHFPTSGSSRIIYFSHLKVIKVIPYPHRTNRTTLTPGKPKTLEGGADSNEA